jgi:hypothetical protein
MIHHKRLRLVCPLAAWIILPGSLSAYAQTTTREPSKKDPALYSKTQGSRTTLRQACQNAQAIDQKWNIQTHTSFHCPLPVDLMEFCKRVDDQIVDNHNLAIMAREIGTRETTKKAKEIVESANGQFGTGDAASELGHMAKSSSLMAIQRAHVYFTGAFGSLRRQWAKKDRDSDATRSGGGRALDVACKPMEPVYAAARASLANIRKAIDDEEEALRSYYEEGLKASEAANSWSGRFKGLFKK